MVDTIVEMVYLLDEDVHGSQVITLCRQFHSNVAKRNLHQKDGVY